MDIKEVFAQRLIQLREDNNITQQALADDLGITRQSLSLYEKADRTINIDLLYKIAKYFNVSSDYLLGLVENHTTDFDLQKFLKYTGLNDEAYEKLYLNFVLKETFKRHNIDDDSNYIQNWIISNNYLSRIICVLSEIKKMSEDIVKIAPKGNSLSYNSLYELYDMIQYGTIYGTESEEFRNECVENSDIFDDLIQKNTFCDTKRYNLIQIVEEMANYFDQRKQVKKNGKHNPAKE